MTAEEVAKLFVECIVAPGFADAARRKFSPAKKICACWNCRKAGWSPTRSSQLKRILGGVLVQQPDLGSSQGSELKVVTKRAPTEKELARPALRLEGLQAREVQRDCFRERRRTRWAWAPAR